MISRNFDHFLPPSPQRHDFITEACCHKIVDPFPKTVTSMDDLVQINIILSYATLNVLSQLIFQVVGRRLRHCQKTLECFNTNPVPISFYHLLLLKARKQNFLGEWNLSIFLEEKLINNIWLNEP